MFFDFKPIFPVGISHLLYMEENIGSLGSEEVDFTKWNQWCPTWVHFQPWILSFVPAPWGRLCGWFPFSSPKYRGPNPEIWCHGEERPLRCPFAWASSSEGPSGPFAKDPWEEASDASFCAIKRRLQKWGRACPPSWRVLMSSYSHLKIRARFPGLCPAGSFLLKSNGEFLSPFSSFVQCGNHNGNSKLTLLSCA